MNAAWKTLILFDMVILFGAGIVIAHRRGDSTVQLVLHRALRQGIAVSVLLALLLTAAELGAPEIAGLFATLIVLGYVLGAAGALGPAILNVETEVFG